MCEGERECNNKEGRWCNISCWCVCVRVCGLEREKGEEKGRNAACLLMCLKERERGEDKEKCSVFAYLSEKERERERERDEKVRVC